MCVWSVCVCVCGPCVRLCGCVRASVSVYVQEGMCVGTCARARVYLPGLQ